MESPNPRSIQSDTLVHALALNGTSLLILNESNVVTWASEAAHQLFDRHESRGLQGTKWEDLIQIDGETVWDRALDDEYRANGYLKTDGFCDAGRRGRIAIELVMYPNQGMDERLVVIRDITEHVAHQQALEDEKRNAESLNQALQKEIEKANELAVMAERANIAKSVFLTSMSHEFRTPLNGVLGYAQILNDDESLSDKNRKSAATIERCGQHLLSIINDVLDLSKIEAGKVEVSKEPLNLKNLITDVIDVFKVRADSKGLILDCVYDLNGLDLDWVSGDSKLIRQVLINLIGNAVKFTDQGSVTLQITARSPDEKDLLYTWIRMSVIDTGPGIEKKYLDQVFEEFYQTEAFSGHKGGTGLGLAISRKLAIAMGGSLSVESKIGKGSSFHFELPTSRLLERGADAGEAGDVHALTFTNADIAYLQVFNEELDSGVLAGLMQSMGMHSDVCYTAKRSIRDVNPALHDNWLIGVSAGGLLADNAQELVEWAAQVRNRVVVLLYVDRSQSKCQSFMESLRFMNPPVIPVEIPIHVNRLKETFAKQCSFLFREPRQTETESDQENSSADLLIGALSDRVPDKDTLKQLLKEAHMGDILRLTQKLDAWVETIQQASHFEVKVKQLIESFKIDQLCQFLEQRMYQDEEDASA